jgi:hypothetical protein
MCPSGFSKVGASARKRLYGPRAALACGYTVAEQDALLGMLERFRLIDLPALFATAADADRSLGEILAASPGHGRGEDSPLPRAVILSGVTEKELSTVMAAWKHLGLPAQNWATLTPTSEGWTLMDLLAELDLERLALSRKP